jgi:predicted 2-oxoglutarate/Fe(II)-dependent dioxygenase YbiX
MIRYTEGGECKKHLDRSSNQTYIFMLSDNFTGGKLLVNDIDSNICKGDVVCFNGQREHHAVTEITRGIRDVLVVWTKPKRNEGTYLI